METKKECIPSFRKSEIAGFAFEKYSPILTVSVINDYIASPLFLMIIAGLIRAEKITYIEGNIHEEFIPEASDNVKINSNKMGTEMTRFLHSIYAHFLIEKRKVHMLINHIHPAFNFCFVAQPQPDRKFLQFFCNAVCVFPDHQNRDVLLLSY